MVVSAINSLSADQAAMVVDIDDFNFRQAASGLSGIDKREAQREPNSDLFHDVSP